MKVSSKVPKILAGLSIVLLATGIGLGIKQQLHNSNMVKIAKKQGIKIPSTKKPEESAFSKYSVKADLPRYIFIPSINVKAIVKQVGVTKTNQIDTPDNIYDTGWFNQSAKPGMAGLSLIDGHLGTWSDKGVFSNLTKLRNGDKFTIQRGDGKVISYVIVKTQMYDANNVDMKALLSPVNPLKPGANLITCSGSVNDGTYQYNKRFVVFAEMQ